MKLSIDVNEDVIYFKGHTIEQFIDGWLVDNKELTNTLEDALKLCKNLKPLKEHTNV